MDIPGEGATTPDKSVKQSSQRACSDSGEIAIPFGTTPCLVPHHPRIEGFTRAMVER